MPGERGKVSHEFPAVFDRESRVLLLGSIPSPKSREVGFYYGHPQNRFWKVLAKVLGEDVPVTIPQKKAMLKKHHVALWDVLESCTIVGASDTSIEDVVPNKISRVVEGSKVTRIFCTGATAFRLYQKYCARDVGIDAVKLPSTSLRTAPSRWKSLSRRMRRFCSPRKFVFLLPRGFL